LLGAETPLHPNAFATAGNRQKPLDASGTQDRTIEFGELDDCRQALRCSVLKNLHEPSRTASSTRGEADQ
jgi:hypothetical protein